MKLVSMRQVVVVSLLAGAAALAGCTEIEGLDGDEVVGEAELGASEQAISCSNASCDGLLPGSTSCVFDQQIVASAGIFGATGQQIGGLALYYSPSCHTVWGATAFYQDQAHRTCAVRRNVAGNQSVCAEYVGSRGNVSPMRFLAVGQTGFGRVALFNNSSITARTGDFTRTY